MRALIPFSRTFILHTRGPALYIHATTLLSARTAYVADAAASLPPTATINVTRPIDILKQLRLLTTQICNRIMNFGTAGLVTLF